MTAVTTGREVATGTLWISKTESTKVRVRVAARCGTPDCTYQGQINIYEESSLGCISEPTRVINLAHISDVSSLNTSHPTVIGGTSSPSLRRNSGLYSSSSPPETLWGFMLVLQSGEAVELFADTREQQQLWIKYLHLMSMFPLSPIPEEPRVNPIRDSYRSKLKLSNFDADSVWPVYILSEEVGSRIQALGVHIITLQSALSQSKPASMSIISPLDNEAIVTWEANRMRRTGSLGNLIFIELGRRCEGGPGLIWMYCSPDDSISFRETITRFLFNGDARPVTSQPDPTLKYDLISTGTTFVLTSEPPPPAASNPSSPSSSGGSSFKLSYSSPVLTPIKKRAEYDTAEVDSLPEYDYAYHAPVAKRNSTMPTDPYGHIMPFNALPISASPPPVNLGSHPSKKAHRRTQSNPPPMQGPVALPIAESDLSSASLLGNRHGGSTDSGVAMTISSTHTLERDFEEIDNALSDMLSDLSSPGLGGDVCGQRDSSPDGLSDLIASLEDFANEDTCTFKRSNSLPSASVSRNHKRANSTSTCHPIHYLEHKKTKTKLTGGHNEYVSMRSAGPALPRLNYDFLETQLSPIKEGSLANVTNSSKGYENFPPPEDIAKGTPTNYVVPYANIGSTDYDDDDIYENTEPVPFKEETLKEPPNNFDSLISSTLNELDNLQNVLEQFGR